MAIFDLRCRVVAVNFERITHLSFEEFEGFVGVAQESRSPFGKQQDAVKESEDFGGRLVNGKDHRFALGSQIPDDLTR